MRVPPVDTDALFFANAGGSITDRCRSARRGARGPAVHRRRFPPARRAAADRFSAPPAGAYSTTPFAIVLYGFGSSGTTQAFQICLPLFASRATTLPREVQHELWPTQPPAYLFAEIWNCTYICPLVIGEERALRLRPLPRGPCRMVGDLLWDLRSKTAGDVNQRRLHSKFAGSPVLPDPL